MAQKIYPETIEKFDKTVKVSTSNQMTEALQNKVVENTAYQGYMWIPFFNKPQSSGSQYVFPVFLPTGVPLEIGGIHMSALSGINGQFLDANGNEIHDGYLWMDTALKEEDVLQLTTSSPNLIFKTFSLFSYTLFYRLKGV